MRPNTASSEVPRPGSRRKRVRIALAVAIGLWGCYGDVYCTQIQEPRPTITGRWNGLTAVGIVAEVWRFELTESTGGLVTGTVIMEASERTWSGTVDGRHSFPEVRLNLDLTGDGNRDSGIYNGHLASMDDDHDTIRGELELGDDPVRTLDLVRGR